MPLNLQAGLSMVVHPRDGRAWEPETFQHVLDQVRRHLAGQAADLAKGFELQDGGRVLRARINTVRVEDTGIPVITGQQAGERLRLRVLATRAEAVAYMQGVLDAGGVVFESLDEAEEAIIARGHAPVWDTNG